jgi:hypothetical protein
VILAIVIEKAMKPTGTPPGYLNKPLHSIVAALCTAALASPGFSIAWPQQTPAAQSQVMTTTTPAAEAPKIPNDQLDSLVALIAL